MKDMVSNSKWVMIFSEDSRFGEYDTTITSSHE